MSHCKPPVNYELTVYVTASASSEDCGDLTESILAYRDYFRTRSGPYSWKYIKHSIIGQINLDVDDDQAIQERMCDISGNC